ncbi:hypothetical protein JOH51_005016 [Rhizobium leguminosarum]|nr:hypothetical protein [Rhizobium leguminosarum]
MFPSELVARPLHPLITQPVIAWLINNTALSNPSRWLATLIVTIPTVYAYPAAQRTYSL